jgi:hypothetical protein
LNDSINELIQTKRKWESRILALGGRDHNADASERFGSEMDQTGDYLYFGAAKNLAVKDLVGG